MAACDIVFFFFFTKHKIFSFVHFKLKFSRAVSGLYMGDYINIYRYYYYFFWRPELEVSFCFLSLFWYMVYIYVYIGNIITFSLCFFFSFS